MNIKELKVGDELVCVKGGHSHFGVGETYIVTGITEGHIRFKGNGAGEGWYSDGAIQYMEKKVLINEDQHCNLKDDSLSYHEKNEMMIDMAVKAVKDGVIKGSLTIQSHSIAFRANRNDYYFNQHYIDEAIEVIQSLYKETFVIESNGDMFRLKVGDRFSQNGSSVIIDKPLLDLLMNTPLFLTKGATVEQSK